MTETANSDDILKRAQQLESYVTLSEETLKSLRIMKQDADKIISSLEHRKDELSQHEQDLVDYLKKLQLVSQKADALLTPITDQKLEVENLSKKLKEGIAGIDGVIQQKMEPLVEKLDNEVKALEEEFHATNEKFHKGLDGSVVDLLQKADDTVNSLAQRVDGCEKIADAHKTALEEQRRAVEREGKDIAEIRKVLQELKVAAEKQRQELKDLSESQSEEFKKIAEKQKEEMIGLVEKRHQELTSTITELNEKHIKNLEKDDAQIKSALNSVIAKLGNVKFKKLLGL
jgi:chromosome segregation ATPase